MTKQCDVCGAAFKASRNAKRCSAACREAAGRPAYAYTAEERRAQNLMSKYGITVAEWEALFDAQGRKCVFGCTEPNAVNWITDHDHATGKVRGILCWDHNIALGWLERHQDDVFDLLSYVAVHKAEVSV